MNFSYPVKYSGKSVYSPNSKYLAVNRAFEVIVKNYKKNMKKIIILNKYSL